MWELGGIASMSWEGGGLSVDLHNISSDLHEEYTGSCGKPGFGVSFP